MKLMRVSILFFACMWCILSLQAQQKKKKNPVTGVSGVALDYYFFQSDSGFKARYLPFNYRIFINANMKVSKKFSLPFSITYTKLQFNTVLPQLPNQKPEDYIKDPRNNVGIHPTFGDWGVFHLGTHTPNYSELSTGNTPIFGAGFELKPGKFNISTSYGYTNLAVKHDLANSTAGAYKRKLMAAKLGYGNKKKTNINFNIVKANDIEASIDYLPNLIKPEEGIIASSDLNIKINKHINFKTEIAGSAFSNDQLSPEVKDGLPVKIPTYLFVPRQSSRMDLSGTGTLDFNFKNWGLGINAKQIGAGYKSLAFPYMLTDYRDFTLNPRLMLIKSKVIFNGTVGYRTDNISETKLVGNRSLLLNTNLTLSVIKNLSLSASYSNFGQQNTIDNDTLKVNFISENYNISAFYKIKANKNSHIVNGMFGNSKFNDLNVITGAQSANNTQLLGGGLTSNFGKKFYTNINYTNSVNKQFLGDIKVNNIGFRLGYKLKKPNIDLSAGSNYTTTQMFNFTYDNVLSINPKIKWLITKKMNFSLSGKLRMIQYGSRNNNRYLNDQYIRTMLTQRF